MYHSITIGNKNSYNDWHLVPDSRPVIAMPAIKTQTIDIPGSNGVLDISESLTGYPLYNNRTGSMKFHVLNDYLPWNTLYEEIANYVHGKRLQMTLEDDPLYYYEGRFSISWTSNNNGTWSDVDINYDLDPYKIFKGATYINLDAIHGAFNVSNTPVTKNYMINGFLGQMPVTPTFVVTNIGGSGLTITLNNSELGITNLTKTINANGTHTFYDMVLSALNSNNTCTLRFSGSGTVRVNYLHGYL